MGEKRWRMTKQHRIRMKATTERKKTMCMFWFVLHPYFPILWTPFTPSMHPLLPMHRSLFLCCHLYLPLSIPSLPTMQLTKITAPS